MTAVTVYHTDVELLTFYVEACTLEQARLHCQRLFGSEWTHAEIGAPGQPNCLIYPE